jgi:LmbE family N-acetylglucosaminyl deacetylase
MKQNILAIGAHPDDIELGCFGTLKLHQQNGDKIFGIVMTNGENGGNPKKRQLESQKTAKLIKMKLYFATFSDGSISDNISTVEYIEKIIKKHKINVVYTHSKHDRHQDHRNTANASISAARNVSQVYSYETPSSIWPFSPQLFVDITKTINLKKKSLLLQKTQEKKYYMKIESIEGLTKYRGFQAGMSNNYCEAFEVIRIMKKF